MSEIRLKYDERLQGNDVVRVREMPNGALFVEAVVSAQDGPRRVNEWIAWVAMTGRDAGGPRNGPILSRIDGATWRTEPWPWHLRHRSLPSGATFLITNAPEVFPHA